MRSLSISILIGSFILGFAASAEPKNLGLSVLPNYGNKVFMPIYSLSVNGAYVAMTPFAKFFNYSDDSARDPKLLIAIQNGRKYAVIDTGLHANADAVQASLSPCAFFSYTSDGKGEQKALFMTEIHVKDQSLVSIDYFLLVGDGANEVQNKICDGGDGTLQVEDVAPEAVPIYTILHRFNGLVEIRKNL